jgi:hypothetical protein
MTLQKKTECFSIQGFSTVRLCLCANNLPETQAERERERERERCNMQTRLGSMLHAHVYLHLSCFVVFKSSRGAQVVDAHMETCSPEHAFLMASKYPHDAATHILLAPSDDLIFPHGRVCVCAESAFQA